MNSKVRRTIESYKMLTGGEGVLVGFSGGADSTALLLVLYELKNELDLRLEAVHINHLLRGDEAEADAAFCREFCRERDIPFHLREYDVAALAEQSGQSVELEAREVRYRAFEELRTERGLQKIATAHQREDVAETVLFRMARGTGLKGLCGIPPVRGAVIRPLIMCSRQEIEDYLQRRGQTWCTDRTNAEPVYSRNRIRLEALPALEQINGSAAAHIADMARRLAADEDYLQKQAKQFLNTGCHLHEDGCEAEAEALRMLHPAIRMRVLLGMCAMLSPIRPEESHLLAVEALLSHGASGRRTDLPDGVTAELSFDRLRFRIKSDQPPYELVAEQPPCRFDVAQGCFEVEFAVFLKTEVKIQRKFMTAYVDYDTIKHNIVVRSRQTGDAYAPLGFAGTKSVKKMMTEQRIPACERGRLPVFAEGGRIIWAAGLRPANAYAVTDATKRVLVITVCRQKEGNTV